MPEAGRRSVSARRLAAYSAAFAALLLALAFVAYRKLLHYEPRAVQHVPAGALLALRVDLTQLVLFEPVREHLLPLVDRVPLAQPSASAVSAAEGRLGRLREQAGLNLGLDLRELVFARLADGWVLAAGGLFPDGELLERVAAVLAAEPGARVARAGGQLRLGPSELTLARAEDGVLLLGSSAAIVERARAASDAYRALGVRAGGPAAWAARPAWLERGAPPTTGFSRVTGQLDYGDPLALTLELEHDPAGAGSPRSALGRWLNVDDAALTPAADWGGERALLARARFTTPSPALTVVTTAWPRSDLERACRSLATWLEGAAARPGPSAQ